MNNNEDIDYSILSQATIVFLPDRNLIEFDCNLLLNKKNLKKEYNYNDQISLLNLSKNKFKTLKLSNLTQLKKLVLSENTNLELLELVDCYNLDHLDVSECTSLKEIIGLNDCNLQLIECDNTKLEFLDQRNNNSILFIKDLQQIQYVIDNVYIGNSKHEEDELIKLGITHIFNISRNHYRDYKTLIEMKYKIEDHSDENILLILPNIIEKIKDLNDNGSKIFVHCFAGVSRSATVVLYYLMFYHKYSLESAFRFLRSKRMGIQPNPGFIRQLISLEKKYCVSKY
jgi:predicted protein tyrosine phosphatase